MTKNQKQTFLRWHSRPRYLKEVETGKPQNVPPGNVSNKPVEEIREESPLF